MINKIIITVIALLTLVGRAHADNLSVGSVKMGPRETKQLEINLVNPDKQYTAFQFDLQLPEGISIAKNDKGNFVASLSDSRKYDHSFAVSALANNTYRFLAYSLSNAVFTGTSGALVSISISSDQALDDGVKVATLKAQVFTDAEGDQSNWEDVAFDITIKDYTKGDVDGDGAIDLADAVLVINRYVGKPVSKFNEMAADVDGDGSIDLADAVRIINFYVGKVESLAPRLHLDGLDPQ